VPLALVEYIAIATSFVVFGASIACAIFNHERNMPATEIVVTSAGRVAGKELLIPTGVQGNVFGHVQDWVTAKLKAKCYVPI
jgi:hypothetical protein